MAPTTRGWNRVAEIVEEQNLTGFWPVESYWYGPYEPRPELDSYLRRALDGTHRYYSLTTPGNYEAYPDIAHPVVAGTGSLVTLYDIWPDASSTCLFLGSAVQGYEVGELVDLGPHQATVCARLSESLAVYSSLGTALTLDGMLLLAMPYADFVDTARVAGQMRNPVADIVTRMVMVDPTDQEIIDYAELVEAGDQGLTLSPRDGRTSSAWYIGQLVRGARLALAATVAVVIVGLAAVGGTLARMVRRTRREYAVHRLLGATRLDVAMRLWSFLALGFVIPSLVLLWLVARAVSAMPFSGYAAAMDQLVWYAVGIAGAAVLAALVAGLTQRSDTMASVVREERSA